MSPAPGDQDEGRPMSPTAGDGDGPGSVTPVPGDGDGFSSVTPALDADGSRPVTPLLDVSELAVRFGPVRAVDGVSLQLPAGPCGLGLVGESGSGKTTIGRAVLRL